MGYRLWRAVAAVLMMGWSAQASRATEAEEAIPPTLVTVQIKDGVAQEVFADLYKQAGLPLEAMPANLWEDGEMQKPVSLNVEKVPFWEAMRQASEKTGVCVQPAFDPAKPYVLARDAGGWSKKPAFVSGPFLVVANGISGNRNLDYGTPQAAASLGVSMTVYVEPKLRLGSIQMALKVSEAVDEEGRSLLLPAAAGAPRFLAGFTWHGHQWSPSASLQWPANGARKIARLKGTLGATVITKSEVWEIADPLSGAESSKTIGKATYTFHGMKQDERRTATVEIYTATLSFKREPGNGQDNGGLDGGAALQGAQLVDAAGKTLKSNGIQIVGKEVTLSFVAPPQALGDPAKLIVDIPTETRAVEIPVEFKDLPLP
jgi:hypothetical protein